MIAWLKVLLPLVALVLLSTIFMISGRTDPGSAVPIGVRGAGSAVKQGVVGPSFEGTTDDGAAIAITALEAEPQEDGLLMASQVDASLRMADGSRITMQSDTAALNDVTQKVEMRGSVEIESSTGYLVTTEALVTSLNTVDTETLAPVDGKGPVGQFTAGRLVILPADESGAVQMLFTDGVKLVYEPQAE